MSMSWTESCKNTFCKNYVQRNKNIMGKTLTVVCLWKHSMIKNMDISVSSHQRKHHWLYFMVSPDIDIPCQEPWVAVIATSSSLVATETCRYVNLRCHWRRQNWHHDDSWFSVSWQSFEMRHWMFIRPDSLSIYHYMTHTYRLYDPVL